MAHSDLPGIVFAPDDEAAVGWYLLRRLLRCPLPIGHPILDVDPLSAPPWELLEGKEDAFFFAFPQAKSSKSSRQKRSCAGGGWWNGERTCAEGEKLHVPGLVGTEVAWRKNALSFHFPVDGEKTSTGWMMHEYAVTAPEDLARSSLRLYRIRLSSQGRKQQSGAMEVPLELGLAPGFMFAPDDEVVVGCYLLRRLLGWPLPIDGLILEADPLSAPPWELLEGKEDAFFFAFGQAKSNKDSRQKRSCAGGGSWNGERTYAEGEKLHVPGLGGTEVAWRKKALSFHFPVDGEKTSTGWMMHEYVVTAPEDLAQSRLRLYRVKFSGHGKKRKDSEDGAASTTARRAVVGDAPSYGYPSSLEAVADSAKGNCNNGADHSVAPVTISSEQDLTPGVMVNDSFSDIDLESLDIDGMLRELD